MESFFDISYAADDFFDQHQWLDNHFEMPLQGQYNQLKINVSYIQSVERKSISILSYGKADDMAIDIGLLKCLDSYFSPKSFVSDFNQFEYWNLMDGEINTLDISEIAEIQLEDLGQGVSRLLEQ